VRVSGVRGGGVSGYPRDKRTRSPVFSQAGETQWVTDTGTDFNGKKMRSCTPFLQLARVVVTVRARVRAA
jgi:hypothetical protein